MSSNEDKYNRQLTRLGKRQATREEQIWFGRYNALRRSVNEMKKEIRILKGGKNIVASSPTVIIAPTVAHSDTTGKTIDDHHNKLHTVEHQVGGNDRIVALDFFNSSFEEQFNFTVTSNGTVITGSLEKTGTGDLTMQFANQSLVILDCTPALTVTITPGTDTVPVYRYYYVLESAPTIITEGTNWPSAEHVPVAKLNVPSAAFVQTKNVYSNQNINNMRALVAGDLSGMGRHLGHKIRESIGATYKSVGGGLAGAAGGGEYLDVSGGTIVRFKMDAGVLMQMHDHAFNAVDTDPAGAGDVVLVRNFSGTAWNDISNIYDIVNDNLGASINNKYFNIIVVAIASKETDYVMINTPGGSYSTLAKAIEDKDRFDDYTIPIEFKGVSTLICRMTIRKAASAWVVHQIDDLRGTNPAVLSGAPVTGGYSDTDVEAYVSGVAVTTPVAADWFVYSDAGVLKRALISGISHSILSGLGGKYTDAEAQKTQEIVPYLFSFTNGCGITTFGDNACILFPASDPDCNTFFAFNIPVDWTGTTIKIHIYYMITAAGGYAVKFYAGCYTPGDTFAQGNFNVANADTTNYDLPALGSNITGKHTYSFDDADIEAGSAFGMRIISDSGSNPVMYILGCYMSND